MLALAQRQALAAGNDSVTIAFPMDIPSWDPHAAGNSVAASITKCVFDQPLELASDLTLGPGVVSLYEWLGNDGKTLALKFRNDVVFHNGDRLTSDDFRFSFFDRPRAEKTLYIGGVWHGIEGIETPSATDAIVHFSAPMGIAPVMLADIPAYIVPRAYFEKVGRDGFMAKPIGSGPYKLVDYQRDSQIVLEANSKHWRGAPAIRRVTFRVVKDPVARAAALQSGQADVVSQLTVREATRLGALPGKHADLHETTGIVLLQMVNKGILQNRDLRLAAHHAIDKQAINTALFSGHATPIYTPSQPGMPAFDPNFKVPFDLARAQALMAQAGYSASNPARINLYTTKGVFASDYEVAQAIAQMWQKANIVADIKVLPLPMLFDYQNHDKFDGPVLKPWGTASGDPGTYSGYMLDPKIPFSIWKSDDIPARLYPLLAETDAAKRIAGFKMFDKWQVEQGYSIPLFGMSATLAMRSSLKFTPYRSGLLLPYSWA